MIKEIVVVSDMWGEVKSQWFSLFLELVPANISLRYFDSSKLGNVNLEQNDEEQIHNQFVEFGIENAVNTLLANNLESKIFIGCSVGGVIAWRAALRGLNVDKLITISSTRLRYETHKPDCEVINYFGQSDVYRPKADWLTTTGRVTSNLIAGGHEIYKNRNSLIKIFDDLNL